MAQARVLNTSAAGNTLPGIGGGSKRPSDRDACSSPVTGGESGTRKTDGFS